MNRILLQAVNVAFGILMVAFIMLFIWSLVDLVLSKNIGFEPPKAEPKMDTVIVNFIDNYMNQEYNDTLIAPSIITTIVPRPVKYRKGYESYAAYEIVLYDINDSVLGIVYYPTCNVTLTRIEH